MFGKGGLGNLMKQAQQMQEKMQKMQEEIAQLEVTGESGAGLVKVTINGAHNCRRDNQNQAEAQQAKIEYGLQNGGDKLHARTRE